VGGGALLLTGTQPGGQQFTGWQQLLLIGWQQLLLTGWHDCCW
jgi:hypothetical protein